MYCWGEVYVRLVPNYLILVMRSMNRVNKQAFFRTFETKLPPLNSQALTSQIAGHAPDKHQRSKQYCYSLRREFPDGARPILCFLLTHCNGIKH